MFGLHLVSVLVGAVGGAVATVLSAKVYAWVKKQTLSVEAKAAAEVAVVKADVAKKI
jgi:hypothetical protein